MSAPTTGISLLIVLVFLLPGSVYGLVYERMRGPAPGLDIGLRVLRATTVSTALATLYGLFLGRYATAQIRTLKAAFDASNSKGFDELIDHFWRYGLWATSMLFLIPAILAVVSSISADKDWFEKLPLGFVRPAVPVWDQLMEELDRVSEAEAHERGHLYVKILTKDDVWYGGVLTDRALVSTYPRPAAVYLRSVVDLDVNGEFVADADGNPLGPRLDLAGMLISCEDAKVIQVAYSQAPGENT